MILLRLKSNLNAVSAIRKLLTTIKNLNATHAKVIFTSNVTKQTQNIMIKSLRIQAVQKLITVITA